MSFSSIFARIVALIGGVALQWRQLQGAPTARRLGQRAPRCRRPSRRAPSRR